jgi:hypothetical protein
LYDVLSGYQDKYREDEDRDGLRNAGFFAAQPFDAADSPRGLHILSRRESNECHYSLLMIYICVNLIMNNLMVFSVYESY